MIFLNGVPGGSMKTNTIIRGLHSDFYVLEMKGQDFLIESVHRTLVNVGESLEVFQKDQKSLAVLEIIHNELFALTSQTSSNGANWEVFAWMGEFSSAMSLDGGYQITYSVRYTGTMVKAHLLEIDKHVAQIRERAEDIVRSNFKQFSEKTGKEVHILI
jgi:hypothetical protein